MFRQTGRCSGRVLAAIAAVALTITLTPTEAIAKQPLPTIAVTIADKVGAPGFCSISVQLAKPVKPNQPIYLSTVASSVPIALSTDAGITIPGGYFTEVGVFVVWAKRPYRINVLTSGWVPVLGTDDKPASWRVSNTCRPPRQLPIGTITARIDRADNYNCTVSLTWSQLMAGQPVYLGSAFNSLRLAYPIAQGGSTDVLVPALAVANWRATLLAGGWGPVLDVNGDSARTRVINHCSAPTESGIRVVISDSPTNSDKCRVQVTSRAALLQPGQEIYLRTAVQSADYQYLGTSGSAPVSIDTELPRYFVAAYSTALMSNGGRFLLDLRGRPVLPRITNRCSAHL